jgi:hypothetical protein
MSFEVRCHQPTGNAYAVMTVWPETHLAYLCPTHVSGEGKDALFKFGTGVPSVDGLLFERTLVVEHSFGYACMCPWAHDIGGVVRLMQDVARQVLAPFDAVECLSQMNTERSKNFADEKRTHADAEGAFREEAALAA